MDVRYLSHKEYCPQCGNNALITDGKLTFCSVINCRWTKPYATITKGESDDIDKHTTAPSRPPKI